jgi:hypothetical protein
MTSNLSKTLAETSVAKTAFEFEDTQKPQFSDIMRSGLKSYPNSNPNPCPKPRIT